jgi:hypothetical protein
VRSLFVLSYPLLRKYVRNMDGRYTELELEFIMEVLDKHGEYLSDLLTEAIDQKSLIKEGILIEDIHFQVKKYGINPVLTVSFPDYGRFIEIKYHKKSQNTSFWKTSHSEAKDAIWGRKADKMKVKKKKDTRWYAKNVYGSINRLIGILMYEFTEEEKTRLKNIIEYRKTSAS